MNRWSGLVAAFCVVVPMGVGLLAQKPDAAGQQRELPYSDAFKKCSASAESTQAIVECHDAETALWDKRLNTVYQALMKTFAADDKESPLTDMAKGTTRVGLLREAERAWITFRDSDCRVQTLSAEGGSLSRVIYASCVMDHTVERALLLEQLAKDIAGSRP